MKKGKSRIDGERDDELRPEYAIDYRQTRPNPYAGRVKFSHGGARPGAGRRPRFAHPMVRKTVRLTAEEIASLERLGAGSLSEGIRAALRKAGARR